jgi:hypothetical protein
MVVSAFLMVGFDFTKHTIPRKEILSGASKDGIPAILKPRFVRADEAGFLGDGDRVIGTVEGGVAKAYPIRILNWHEVVNDRLGSTPIVVTY